MASRSKAEWVELGKEAVIGVLRSQGAATIRELEARASDRTWTTLGSGVDPHLLTESRRALEASGSISRTRRPGRGPGEPITTYHLPRRYGTATTIDRASARKRLLTVRFQGWARGNQRYPRGLIGPAGETSLSTALTELANAGYTPAGAHYGETAHLLGARVQGGALDNAAFLTITDRLGRPDAYTVPFEVKNIREWIYGRSAELHQLLYKAARLQIANPDVPIVPVLVCRKRQETARQLGIAIGFYSVQYRTQLVAPAPGVPEHRFDEVQTELGYQDIRRTLTPPAVMKKALRESVTRDAPRTAERWAECAPALIDHFATLRRSLTNPQRTTAWYELLDAIETLGIDYGGDLL